MATDPELMKGVDPKRISRQNKARAAALEPYRSRTMSNRNAWCVASVPSAAWAMKVFPNKTEAEAIEALWDAIYKAVRVDTPDPVKSWRDHQAALNARLAVLKKHDFASLRYENGLGTDLVVALPKGHQWFGGGDECSKGYVFVANMPTEELKQHVVIAGGGRVGQHIAHILRQIDVPFVIIELNHQRKEECKEAGLPRSEERL